MDVRETKKSKKERKELVKREDLFPGIRVLYCFTADVFSEVLSEVLHCMLYS